MRVCMYVCHTHTSEASDGHGHHYKNTVLHVLCDSVPAIAAHIRVSEWHDSRSVRM